MFVIIFYTCRCVDFNFALKVKRVLPKIISHCRKCKFINWVGLKHNWQSMIIIFCYRFNFIYNWREWAGAHLAVSVSAAPSEWIFRVEKKNIFHKRKVCLVRYTVHSAVYTGVKRTWKCIFFFILKNNQFCSMQVCISVCSESVFMFFERNPMFD